MTSALALLNVDYTDSEEEHAESPEKAPQPPLVEKDTPSTHTGSAVSTPTKLKTRLVSYLEEGAEEKSDDERDPADKAEPAATGPDTFEAPADSASQVVPMELDSDQEASPEGQAEGTAPTEVSTEDDGEANSSVVEVEAWTGGVQLPPEPEGMCDPKLQKSIEDLYKRKQERGLDMNGYIQGKKSFRNPSIYEKLIEFCGIDEHGTNFPKDLFDGHLFGAESYYEELRKVQDADIERREKAAKSRSKAEAKRPEDGSAPKRRSKWDQAGAPGAALLSSQAGALAKSISAFGPLKK